MVESISHLTFIVRDLEKSTRFFTEIFAAQEVYDSSAENFSLSREKFFLIGTVWIALMEGEPLSERSYNHVAFKIAPVEFENYAARVERLGVDIKAGRPRVEGEAQSLYFYDYDNHLFELHTGTLQERLGRYLRD
jgi:catechol 2,3-dioxygenase-like lactoylglutathione lyase family enzyme